MCTFDIASVLRAGGRVCPECGAPISLETACTPPPAEPAARGLVTIAAWWVGLVAVGLGLAMVARATAGWHIGGFPAVFVVVLLANVSWWLFVGAWLILAWADNLVRVLRLQMRLPGGPVLFFVLAYPATMAAVYLAYRAISPLVWPAP